MTTEQLSLLRAEVIYTPLQPPQQLFNIKAEVIYSEIALIQISSLRVSVIYSNHPLPKPRTERPRTYLNV